MDEPKESEEKEFADAVFAHVRANGGRGCFGHQKDCPCPLCCDLARRLAEQGNV